MSELAHWSDDVTEWIHRTLEPISMLSNCYLIFIILRYTPAPMKIYSCLILYHALFDILASFSLFMTSARFIVLDRGRVYVFRGMCQYFGPHVCYVLNNAMLHGLAHCMISIAASFCFRFYILVKQNPTLKQMIVFLFLLWTPSIFQFVTFHLAETDHNDLYNLIQNYPLYAHFINGTTFSGNTDVLEWKTMFCNFYLGAGAGVVLPVTLTMRKAISKRISSEDSMSEKTRTMHQNLLRVLLLQSVSPCIFISAFVPFSLMSFGIYSHPIMENFIFGSCGIVPSTDAFINLLFVRAYRKALLGHILRLGRFLRIKKANVIAVHVLPSSGSMGKMSSSK